MANSPFRFFYTKTLDALKRRFSPTRERNHGTLAQWAILGVSSGYLQGIFCNKIDTLMG